MLMGKYSIHEDGPRVFTHRISIRGAIAYASGIACKEASPEQANEYFDQSKAHFSLAAKLLPDDEKDRLGEFFSLFE